MSEQKGYIFHRGKSWFVRYCDNVLQGDGSIKRKLVCKKLPVSFGDQYRTKASVRSFAQEVLAPVMCCAHWTAQERDSRPCLGGF